MAATLDDLNVSDEDFAERFLGITPSQIAHVAGYLDIRQWDGFWAGIRTTIETSTELNFEDSDTEEIRELKRNLKARALQIFLSFQRNAQDERDRSIVDSEVVIASRNYVGQFEAIADQIRENEVVRVAQTLLGPTNLDPTNIHVSEVSTISRQGTLRSDTDAAIKLPRTVTQISIDLVFPGPDQINTVLRPLLATLLASPVTTLESPFLTAALINHYSTPEIEEEIRRRVLQTGANTGLIDDFSKFSSEVVSSFEKIQDLIENNDLVLEYYRQLSLMKEERTGLVGQAATTTEEKKLPDIGVPVPVVFQDIVISTDPETPNTLHVRLSFLRFNSKAFGIYGIEYRDQNGNRTPDIMQCEFLKKYAEWAFLQPGSTDRKCYLEEYKAHTFGNTPDFRCTWDDLLDPRLVRMLETDKFVVASVQLALGMKIVPLPVIGAKYPAVHVLGKGSIQAKVVLHTTSKDTIRAFALMKDHLDAISRNAMGQFRDEQIEIENSVLNLVGARKFLISSCDMEPLEGTSNGFQIELALVQAEYSYSGQQALILEDQAVPERALRDLWQRLWVLYKEFRQGSDGRTGAGQIISPEAKLAGQFLFGRTGDTGERSIINSDILTAAALRMVSGSEYNTREAVIATYRQLFLPRGTTAALGNNTDTAQGGFQLFSLDPSQYPQAAVQLGGIVRTTLTGQGQLSIGQQYGGGFSVGPQGQIMTDAIYQWRTNRKFLAEQPFRTDIAISSSLWDAILEVIIDPRQAPNAVRQVNTTESEFIDGKDAYNYSELDRVYKEFHWLFTSGQVTRFGIDLKKYMDLGSEQRLLLDEDASAIQRRRLVSNYPDLPLPTYADLFPDDRIVTDVTSRAQVPLWTRFCPTYSDLGILPPLQFGTTTREALFQRAREKTDTMEPGFWFHHERLREGMLARAEAGLKVPGQTVSEISTNVLKLDVNTESILKLPQGAANATLSQLIQAKLREDAALRKQVDAGRKNNVYYDVISSEGAAIGVYAPADRVAGNHEYKAVAYLGRKKYISTSGIVKKTFDRKDENHNRALVMRALRNNPDNTFSMGRMYPAFRLYFVEWDNNQNRENPARLPTKGRVIRMIDDLYTTNCVLSMVITDSKEDSAVAEVELLNTVGTFDTDRFLLPNEARALNVGRDDENEDFLSRMRLQTGTGIIIKVGYSSDANGLKTIFTGQIAEIQPGKILRFIAQGYKVELDQEVGFEVASGNPREAINRLLRINNENANNLTPHFGRVFDTRDMNEGDLTRIFGELGTSRTGTFGLQGPGGFLAKTFGYAVNDISRNVWLESDVGPDGAIDQAIRNIRETFDPTEGSPDIEYHFWNQTAWQGLQEMTRHLAGTICAVRPFDAEATAFFGYPDQPYQFRQPRGLELFQWEHTSVPQRIESILGLERAILLRFWGSKFGTTSETQTEHDFKNATAKGTLPTTGQRINGLFVGGSALANTMSIGFIDELSESYTGFIRWALSVGRYGVGAGIGSMESFGSGIQAGVTHIPIFESLKLDFSSDWATIGSYNPTLQRFLFAYFFRLRYTGGPWPGAMESRWQEIARMGMLSLRNANNSPNSNWEMFKRALSGPGDDFSFDGEEFPTGFDAMRNPFDDPQEALSAARASFSELVRSGAMTQEQMAERMRALEEALIPLSGLPDMATVNNAFRGDALQDPDSVSEVLLASWPFFRLFIHYFAGWVRTDLAAGDAGVLRDADTRAKFDTLDDTQLPSWYKPFRDYHAVFASHDIIDNSIVATTTEMVNTILIRGPKEALSKPDDAYVTESGERVFNQDTNWQSWPNAEGVPFHPNIKRSSRKLGVAVEPNCNSLERTAQCLMTNMALGLRPMYRGELKIIGRAVMPWDVVVIHDEYTGMFGIVEVERVTHEFSSETGWITTIVPHAYCHANNPWGLWQLSSVSSPLGWLGLAVDALFLASLAVMTWGVGSALYVAGRAAARGAGMAYLRRHAAAGAADAIAAQGTTAAGVIQQMVGVQLNGAVKRGLVTARLTSGFRGAGAWLTQNWVGVGTQMGRMIGGAGILNAFVNPGVDLLYNMTIKNRISNTLIPVDFRPVSFKGFPLSAGLDLTDEQVIPYGEKAEGVFKSILDSIQGFFETAVTNPPGSSMPGGGPGEG